VDSEDRTTRLMVIAIIIVMIVHHRATQSGYDIPEINIPQYCRDVQDCGWVTTTSKQAEG